MIPGVAIRLLAIRGLAIRGLAGGTAYRKAGVTFDVPGLRGWLSGHKGWITARFPSRLQNENYPV
jgi:hypothetical protein